MALSLDILKNHNFRLLFLTRTLCHMGLQASAVIVGWQIYTLTHSEFLLGLIGLTEAVPAILSALFSGYIVDLTSPYFVYRLCVGTLVLNMAFLWAVGGEWFAFSQSTVIALLFAGIFVSGIARSFLIPAFSALFAQAVEKKHYAASNGWSNAGIQIAVIVGPLTASLVYGFYGVRAAWTLPTVFMILGFLSILHVRNLRAMEQQAFSGSAIKNIIDGWHFILKRPLLLTVMGLDMVTVLFGGAVAMLPAFADQVLHVGPEGLGLLRTAPALGAILTAVYFALFPMRTFPLSRMLWAAGGFGACMIGFGFSETLPWAMFFLGLSGLLDTVSVIIRLTLKQILTPDYMRGRVSAISSMFVISSNELGAFESGVAARLMGLIPSIIFGGVVSIGICLGTYVLTPQLRQKIYTDEDQS